MSHKILNRKLNKLITSIEKYCRFISYDLSIPSEDQYDKRLLIGAQFYTLIELSKTITVLIDENKIEGILIIMRTCLLLYIHILNVSDIENYQKYMSSEKHKTIKYATKKFSAIDTKNMSRKEMIDTILELENIEKKLEPLSRYTNKKLTDFDSRNICKLTKDEKDAVNLIYEYLSEYVHMGLNAIRERNFIKSEDGYKVTKKCQLENIILYLLIDSLSYYLLKSTFLVCYKISHKNFSIVKSAYFEMEEYLKLKISTKHKRI